MLVSPYVTGPGDRPVTFAGREQVLAHTASMLAGVAATGRPTSAAVVLVGNRGMGKTVALEVIADQAREQGFLVADATFDVDSDNIRLLASGVARAVGGLQSKAGTAWRQLSTRLGSLDVEVNVAGVVSVKGGLARSREDPTGQRAVLGDLLHDAAAVAVDHDRRGLVVLVDELQEGNRTQLSALANAIKDVGLLHRDQPGPFQVVAAGLRTAPGRLMDAASFAQRFRFFELGPLDHSASQLALLQPALSRDVYWSSEAAEAALRFAQGSPYLIQLAGEQTWLAADPHEPKARISVEDAVRGVDQAGVLIQVGYEGVWRKLRPREREVVTEVARALDPAGIARTAHVGLLLGKETKAWSRDRDRLLEAGVLDAPGYGELAFAQPGFSDFALRRTGHDPVPLEALEAQAAELAARRPAQLARPPHGQRRQQNGPGAG